ncbi:putative O-methyltransferase [Paraphoma chrysanthemicola]|uniref:O-methyltransferase n=1 Tax=Paraphoma chrysanthemicola TaxID=798071 RepID=A0A8K0RCE5_9PLEO|nr:putative O-methyltransferase [Paraphoma chrysanthemicola]
MASTQSRIAALSAIISSNTQKIDEYLKKHDLPQPSFSASAPLDLNLPPELERARIEILHATQELNDLLQGPRDLLFNHQHGKVIYLDLLTRYNIASLVPSDGTTTFTQLAEATGAPEGPLTRIMRLAIAHRVFAEPEKGRVAHSAASKVLVDDERVAAWWKGNMQEMWPSAGRVVDALVKWPSGEGVDETGFQLANNTTKSFYQVLGEDPARAKRFALAMDFFAQDPGYAMTHVVNSFEWSALPENAVIVDLGGSTGDLAFTLSATHPDFKIIVQELPEVVAQATTRPGVNVTFEAHDFFSEQPVHGANVYVFRWVLHNWPDKYSVQILRALIPALVKGAKVLVLDFVMPEPGLLPNEIERKLRAMDLTMLQIANAREREMGEWKELFGKADKRFRFVGARSLEGSKLTMLEVVWDQ